MSKPAIRFVFAYFRPAALQGSGKPTGASRASARLGGHGADGLYLSERSCLNREAHFLAGVVSMMRIGGEARWTAERRKGTKILCEAHRALELQPQPELSDVRTIRRVRAAIRRFLASLATTPARSRRRSRLRDS